MLQHPSSDMLNVYTTPGRILFGLDAVDQVGVEAAALGAKKALLVCTPSAIRHGVAGKIKDLLSKEGVSSYIYDRIGPDPDTAIVDQCTESACSIACDPVSYTHLDVYKRQELLCIHLHLLKQHRRYLFRRVILAG